MSNVKVDNNNRNVNVKGNPRNLQNEEDDWDDEDLYDDFNQGRWQKGNQRKVLKFKEHKAK